jgi:hypothetical protein
MYLRELYSILLIRVTLCFRTSQSHDGLKYKVILSLQEDKHYLINLLAMKLFYQRVFFRTKIW